MAKTFRPPKAAQTNTYQGEVAAGKFDIIDSELDADFDTIYDLCNGKLDWTNLSGSASIRYNQLVLTGQIQQKDLAPGFVLPPGTIGPPELIDGAFVTTIDNITPGVTVKDQRTAGTDVDEGTIIPPSVETIVAETTWTTRGGFWIAWGLVNGAVLVSNPADDVTARLRVGGTTAGQVDGTSTVVQKHLIHLTASQPDPINIFVPYTAALIHSGAITPQAAARLQLTVHHTRGQLLISSPRIVVMEQA